MGIRDQMRKAKEEDRKREELMNHSPVGFLLALADNWSFGMFDFCGVRDITNANSFFGQVFGSVPKGAAAQASVFRSGNETMRSITMPDGTVHQISERSFEQAHNLWVKDRGEMTPKHVQAILGLLTDGGGE